MRKFILPILIILITLGLGSSSLASVESFTTYLPLIGLDRDTWLGPQGGRIVSMVINPADPRVVYAGTWGAGVYRSLDGGQNWSQINTGLDNLYINSLAIDPHYPWVIYAGTYRDQIYKTIDGGQTWTWSGVGIQDQAIVYTIAIDPNQTHNLYIGTRGISNNGLPPWNGVVYKSNDAGASWTAILENVGGGDAQDWVYSLAVNPQDSSIIYAATHEHGPYRSINYGTSWISVPDGIYDFSGRAIVVDWQAPEPYTLYMGVWHGDGVYRSDDGGELWYQTNAGIQGVAIYSLAMDPFDPQVIYQSTFSHGIMRTPDGGGTWLVWGLRQDNIYTVAINPQNSAVLYAGTAGDGLYRSLDGGVSWQHSQHGILNADSVSVIPTTDSSHVYTALFGGGVLETHDGGLTWAEMNYGLTDNEVLQMVSDPLNPEVLFALTNTGGLFRNNTSNSDGWVWIGQDLPLAGSVDPAYPQDHPRASRETLLGDLPPSAGASGVMSSENLLDMVFAPSNPSIAYLATGGSGVYRSINHGSNWTSAGLEGQYVSSLAVDPYNADLVYAVTYGAGFIRYSEYGGGSWSNLNLYVTNAFCVAVASDGSGTLYAGTSNGVYAYSPATGWGNIGLSWTSVNLLETDLEHPGLIFAGTPEGVYYSTDGGLNWQRVPADLDGLTVQSISFDPVDPHIIYFGTQSRGILKAFIWY